MTVYGFGGFVWLIYNYYVTPAFIRYYTQKRNRRCPPSSASTASNSSPSNQAAAHHDAPTAKPASSRA